MFSPSDTGSVPWYRNPYIARTGMSAATALLSTGLSTSATAQEAYLVHNLGQWVLCTATEVREYAALGFIVYNPHTMSVIREEDWTTAVQPVDATGAFGGQETVVDEVLDAVEDELDPESAAERKADKSVSKKSTPKKGDDRSPSGSNGKKGPDAGAGSGSGAGVSV